MLATLTESPTLTPRSAAVAVPRATSLGPSGSARPTPAEGAAENRLERFGLDLAVRVPPPASCRR